MFESEGVHSINGVYKHKALHHTCKHRCGFYPSDLHPFWLSVQSQPLINFCRLPVGAEILTSDFPERPLFIF